METRASYTIVGAFVLAFFFGMVGTIVWLADFELNAENARFHILFDGSVTGLQTGNPVRYRGIPVGIVTEMEINPDNVEQVRVTIEVPVETPIKQDATASLEFQGLTGVAFVQISGGTHDAPNLRAELGDELPIIPSTPSQIEELFEKAPELLTRFIGLVDRANDILNTTNQRNIQQTLSNLTEFTGALAESSGDIQILLSEGGATLEQFKATAREAEILIGAFADRSDSIAALAEKTLIDVDSLVVEAEGLVTTGIPVLEQTGETMIQVEGIVQELRPHVGPLAESTKLSLDEFNKIAADLRYAARNIGNAADEASQLLDNNQDSLSEFANTGLYEFTQLIAESRVLIQVLTRISNELERDPARFFFGDQSQGFQAE